MPKLRHLLMPGFALGPWSAPMWAKPRWLLPCLVGAIALLPQTASADLTLDINAPLANQGGSEATVGHLTATFTQNGATEVDVTIKSFLTPGEFLKGSGGSNGSGQEALFFNYGPNAAGSTGADGLTFSSASISGTHFDKGVNVDKADGDGWYDWGIYFDSAQLSGGNSLTFKITGSGILENQFNFTSSPNKGADSIGTTAYYAAAHIQGAASVQSGSTFFGSGQGSVTATPEPSTMLITAVGAIGFLGYGLRRRRMG